jgi:mRNA interferase RelE/StbE
VKVIITKSANLALKKSNKRMLIAKKIRELAISPDDLQSNIIKMQNRADYRLRVQDWRIIFRREGDVLYIEEIEPRGSAYKERK